jgi:lipoprotein NlpD
MSGRGLRPCSALAAAGLALLLSACGSAPVRAPVEARGTPTVAPPVAIGSGATGTRSQAPAAAAGAASSPGSTALRTAAGAENAGKPGYYTVKSGDTLIRVSLDHGQNWRDVARWNAIENPNLIEVGQVLRVAPPELDGGGTVARASAVPPVPRPDPAPASTPAPAAVAAPGAVPAPDGRPAAAASAPAPAGTAGTEAPPARVGDEAVDWAWPASGSVVAGFDEARGVKGVSIAGRAGDPVLAAADGRVVYAGSGLRGYGNLVIVKHNNTFLTAYAHNQALLVKEDQAVRRGQKIAEMGATDAERVKLHFEIRRQGRPVDPAKLLPAR